MAMQNPFIAKARLQTLRHTLPVSQNFIEDGEKDYIPEGYLFNELPVYKPITRLSDNIVESMRMLSDIQKLRELLPGIDCGACGAPTCRAFAEDVVRKGVSPEDCPINKSKKEK
ncbi:MAG: hypothetical protein IKS12_03635 [Eubacterium sp.]|nr:hypothetical protein [Eubacterium sp.]